MNQPLNWRLILNTTEHGWPADLIADAKAARSAEMRQLLVSRPSAVIAPLFIQQAAP